MSTNKQPVAASSELKTLLDQQLRSSVGLQVISLSTSDGFDIYTALEENIRVEPDKLAALSSTFSALGTTSVKNMTGGAYQSTILEGDKGNLLLVTTTYRSVDAVLLLVAKHQVNLGELRFIAHRLAGNVTKT